MYHQKDPKITSMGYTDCTPLASTELVPEPVSFVEISSSEDSIEPKNNSRTHSATRATQKQALKTVRICGKED